MNCSDFKKNIGKLNTKCSRANAAALFNFGIIDFLLVLELKN